MKFTVSPGVMCPRNSDKVGEKELSIIFAHALYVTNYTQDMSLMNKGTENCLLLNPLNTEQRNHENRKGAQWLIGRVLKLRPRGRVFEPHQRHCVVVLEQDTFILA